LAVVFNSAAAAISGAKFLAGCAVSTVKLDPGSIRTNVESRISNFTRGVSG